MSRTSPREVFTKILKRRAPQAFLESVVTGADVSVDAALSQLESEEPSLLAWFANDPDVSRILKANAAATHEIVGAGMRAGLDFDATLRRVDALTYRSVVALAVKAVLQDRDKRAHESGGFAW